MVALAEIITRTWIQSQIAEHDSILDIWDSGSHLYERWPDGTENYWKIIWRKEVEGGFQEQLQKMPEWQSPSEVLHREQVPLLLLQAQPQAQPQAQQQAQQQLQAQPQAQAQPQLQPEYQLGPWHVRVVQEQPAELPPPSLPTAYKGNRREEKEEQRPLHVEPKVKNQPSQPHQRPRQPHQKQQGRLTQLPGRPQKQQQQRALQQQLQLQAHPQTQLKAQ